MVFPGWHFIFKQQPESLSMTILQNNNRNTVISCVFMAHVIGFILLLSFPLNCLFEALAGNPLNATLMYCVPFILVAQAGGVILFVLRLMRPAVYKYKLRYNFFAVFNLVLGLFAWIVSARNPGQGDPYLQKISALLGSVMLADIYLLKLKLPPTSSLR